MIDTLHPGLLLIAAGALLTVLHGPWRGALALLAPLGAVAVVLALPETLRWQGTFMGYTVAPFAVDKLSRLFALAFAVMAFGGGLFALKQPNRAELPAALIYAGSAIGVTLAGDLFTVFVFWEVMAIGSTLLIWSAGTQAAYRASMRYAMIHLLGGVILMAGIVGHVAATGSVAFERMALDSPSHWLILIGFLVNVGAPPLSGWLADAYPEASWSGTVFLSAFTTKTAVYVLLRGFPGTELLIAVGLVMVFYGIVYALLENDMRRLLAYGIVNQAGIMVVGIGIGTPLSLNGAAAHAFASIFYTALLLMSAGAVLYETGFRKCTELGGLFRSMPLTMICGTIGALSISSFPWTSGFVSKAMVSQAALDGHLAVVWLLLTAGSAGVFLYAGIKFPWFVFFQRDSGLRPPDPPWSLRLAMLLFAALCIGLGVFYEPLYRMLPFPVDYVPYTGMHVVAMLQLLLFSALAFLLMLPWLKRTLTITLDTDWFYRRLGPRLVSAAEYAVTKVDRAVRAVSLGAVRAVMRGVVLSLADRGRLSRAMGTGTMVLWVALLMTLYLLVYFAGIR